VKSKIRSLNCAKLALIIKSARKKQGKTIKEVALEIGVSAGTYQRWENPKTFNATIKTIEKIANALGLKLELNIEDKKWEFALQEIGGQGYE
jgi:transcriptional regulator with XRE-family HTH domain